MRSSDANLDHACGGVVVHWVFKGIWKSIAMNDVEFAFYNG
jgi:hypothetical protein